MTTSCDTGYGKIDIMKTLGFLWLLIRPREIYTKMTLERVQKKSPWQYINRLISYKYNEPLQNGKQYNICIITVYLTHTTCTLASSNNHLTHNALHYDEWRQSAMHYGTKWLLLAWKTWHCIKLVRCWLHSRSYSQRTMWKRQHLCIWWQWSRYISMSLMQTLHSMQYYFTSHTMYTYIYTYIVLVDNAIRKLRLWRYHKKYTALIDALANTYRYYLWNFCSTSFKLSSFVLYWPITFLGLSTKISHGHGDR